MAMEQLVGRNGFRTLAVLNPNRIAMVQKRITQALPMTSTPPDGYRTTSVVLPPVLAKHVDAQAQRYGISKAGFIRQLIALDREAQARSQGA